MTALSLEDGLNIYPELNLTLKNGACVYRNVEDTVIVPLAEGRLYVRTYEYCKSLISADRYDAAKQVAFSRNDCYQLPFDRLPFLALLTDPGHLIETVRMQPKLEITPEVAGRRVQFFYEEGHRHRRVNGVFVGRHLRSNALCEDDVGRRDYSRAMMRAVTTPLSSRLIGVYDAHLQTQGLIEDFDYGHALCLERKFELGRNVKQEFTDYVMPMALAFQNLYRAGSRDAAYEYARVKGFSPVIRNNRLVTLQKAAAGPGVHSCHASSGLSQIPNLQQRMDTSIR